MAPSIFLLYAVAAIGVEGIATSSIMRSEGTDTSVESQVGNPAAKVALKDSLGLPKNIWLLWDGGWEKAPYVPQMVAASWRLHNPGWNVILLDKENLDDYMDTSKISRLMNIQAQSDYIRITLLSTHGGVWADASLLCMQPLDRWVWQKVQPNGFWMYHGRDGTTPASWFLVSAPGSMIIQKWKQGVDEYWQEQKSKKYNFYWLDEVFARQQKRDAKFQKAWEAVPYVYNHDPCQSALLRPMKGFKGDPKNEASQKLTEEVRQCLTGDSIPYVMKMSWKGALSDGCERESRNGCYAIHRSIGSAHLSKVKYILAGMRASMASKHKDHMASKYGGHYQASHALYGEQDMD